jgi:hypothetical protein
MPGEDPIQPFPRGDVKEVRMDLGTYKNNILFYDLASAEVIAKASPMDWDLYYAEETVKINFLRSMRAAAFDGELESQSDTVGLEFVNLQNQDPMWTLLLHQNYILDMGLDPASGVHLGFYKFRYQGDGHISFARLKETELIDVEFRVDEHYYSLINDSYKDLPKEDEYDFVMGKYLHYFAEEKIDYDVSGMILGSAIAGRTDQSFEAIRAEILDTLELTGRRDIVGYDWKKYSIDLGAYEIVATKHYILQDSKGFYYKLRFTSFYNEKGVSGHPTFEYKLL